MFLACGVYLLDCETLLLQSKFRYGPVINTSCQGRMGQGNVTHDILKSPIKFPCVFLTQLYTTRDVLLSKGLELYECWKKERINDG